MSDAVDLAFELGKIVLKVLREVDESKQESAKLLRSLGGAEKEQIVLQKIGKYWNQKSYFDRPDGLVVVTNYRVVFLAKIKTITTTTDYLSFPLEMIENLEVTRIMLISPAIRFRIQGREYVFTFLENAGEVLSTIGVLKESLSHSYENTQNNKVDQSSKIFTEDFKDEAVKIIEQLKHLHDLGAITDQEFEIKKKEVLARL